jgi:menaquinone-9 beta-reductase
MPDKRVDVLIVGGGPAGAVCAAVCAKAGLRVLVLEKTTFPREKVCGDCINPACWPVLERLEIADLVLKLPHAPLHEVEFANCWGRSVRFTLPENGPREIAVKRILFDDLLLRHALESGAEIWQGSVVTHVEREWKVRTGQETITAPALVAADGRNSSVARMLDILPCSRKDRVGMQTHLPVTPAFERRVVLRLLPEGYCGIADVGGGELNLCLVSRPDRINRLKLRAVKEFQIPPNRVWRTITPLARAAVPAGHGSLLLVGDAARVVEPFTGEGIYYALASGELAANHIIAALKEKNTATLETYGQEHARLYDGRLWINRIAKMAVLYPVIASAGLEIARFHPGALRLLTSKVIGGAQLSAGS